MGNCRWEEGETQTVNNLVDLLEKYWYKTLSYGNNFDVFIHNYWIHWTNFTSNIPFSGMFTLRSIGVAEWSTLFIVLLWISISEWKNYQMSRVIRWIRLKYFCIPIPMIFTVISHTLLQQCFRPIDTSWTEK